MSIYEENNSLKLLYKYKDARCEVKFPEGWVVMLQDTKYEVGENPVQVKSNIKLYYFIWASTAKPGLRTDFIISQPVSDMDGISLKKAFEEKKRLFGNASNISLMNIGNISVLDVSSIKNNGEDHYITLFFPENISFNARYSPRSYPSAEKDLEYILNNIYCFRSNKN